MNATRRRISIALALAGVAPALQAQQLRPGVDFVVLKPELPVDTQGKIEVIEFFWYGCPHCYTLEPLIEDWLKKLPADAAFRRVPAVFNERWAKDAAIFYALEATGNLERLHRPLFDAIHKDGLRTDQGAALGQWLTKNGIDTRKFDEAGRSFGVQSKVRRAAQLSTAYRIDGTPAMAVHGRYTVGAEQSKTQPAMLSTVDYLINLVRRTAPPK
ncbi:MAG TPA: thiol:disulfide interchange protein DsbA/DsbL [Burkholderiales bacterium]|nr:thiol:disulfide interchange protein DsbA/DsbL [Burkholderiales bacterium]